MNYDPRYLKGIELFNAREFFDAHETWEELWHEEHGEAKDFIQGLIQAATALHHFETGNLKGAKILYESFLELMASYPDCYLGLDKGKFVGQMAACFGGLVPYATSALPGRYTPGKEDFPVKLDESGIPKMKLI